MVDLGLLSEADLRHRYGRPTLQRAEDYVGRGHVLSCRQQHDPDGDLQLQGVVAGSTPSPYSVSVHAGVDGEGGPATESEDIWLYSRCSCPVGGGCKHALALVLVVRQEHLDRSPEPLPRWERHLTAVLDELDELEDAGALDADGHGRSRRGLALQVELKQRSRGYRAWSDHGSHPGSVVPSRGAMQLRLLHEGARGAWIRTGVSWQQLRHLDSRAYHDDQVLALTELLVLHRASSYGSYQGSEPHLSLTTCGAGLWDVLARVARAGVPLVAGAGLSQVSVEARPVRVTLDVNTAEDGSSVLCPGVVLAEQWYAATDVDVLGERGHGVALWTAEGNDWQLVLAPLSSAPVPEIRRLLAATAPLVVPAEDRTDLLAEYLPRLHRHVPVTSSDASVNLPEPVQPRLVLTVTWLAADRVGLRWTWRYRVGEDDRVYGLDETRGRRGVRRLEAEQALLDALHLDEEQVHHLCHGHRRERGLVEERVFRDQHAVLVAESLLPGLRAQVEVEEIGTQPDYRESRSAPVVRFDALATRGTGGSGEPDDGVDHARTDWLDLEVVVTVDGEPISLSELLAALTLGRDHLVLRSGLHFRTDRPEFAQLRRLVELAAELRDQREDVLRVGHHDLGLWDELAEVGLVDAQAATWVAHARALRDVSSLPAVDPVGVEAELRSYQLEGFWWLAFLWRAGLGGILADDMGLGKTLQTLALVAHARREGADPFLVVAPTSVVSAWAGEAARFTPGLVVRAVTESQARRGTTIAKVAEGADLVLTSYTLFRMEGEAYRTTAWGGLVLDEAQMVKNHRGKTYQSVRRLDVPFRLAVTGTPMENRLMELWSLLSIVAPGLYPWPRRFEESVARPVERLGDREVLAGFRRRIRPFLLRRTKDLVAADLPAKQEQVLEVTLTPRHRQVYETHLQRERQQVLGLVEDFEQHRIAIFGSLTRLRQLSLDAGLVDEAYDGVGSAKVDVLVDHLLEVAAEGHRALVFSQFTSFLQRVRDRLDREGLASVYLDGRTRLRGQVVEEFRSGDAPVFLISLKAGGVGLTLTEADYCFVLDPWWNPAVEAQAVDRAHRIGQTRPVMVYRLVATDTVEEKVMALKARKAALFDQVVGDDALPSAPLTADDVRALLGTDESG